MPRYNPFRPAGIVTPGMFSGRYNEMESMDQALFQTKLGNPHHILIHGERGIGKSSLLYCHQLVARGEVAPFEGDNFQFITVSVELEPSNTCVDIVEKIGSELQREVAKREPATELAKSAWEFLKKWEVMGVKYKEGERLPKPNELLDELTFTIDRTLDRLGSTVDGIIFSLMKRISPPRVRI